MTRKIYNVKELSGLVRASQAAVKNYLDNPSLRKAWLPGVPLKVGAHTMINFASPEEAKASFKRVKHEVSLMNTAKKKIGIPKPPEKRHRPYRLTQAMYAALLGVSRQHLGRHKETMLESDIFDAVYFDGVVYFYFISEQHAKERWRAYKLWHRKREEKARTQRDTDVPHKGRPRKYVDIPCPKCDALEMVKRDMLGKESYYCYGCKKNTGLGQLQKMQQAV